MSPAHALYLAAIATLGLVVFLVTLGLVLLALLLARHPYVDLTEAETDAGLDRLLEAVRGVDEPDDGDNADFLAWHQELTDDRGRR